jgi:transcription elongation GreA/GreB family factor
MSSIKNAIAPVVPEPIQKALAAGDLDIVEKAWQAHFQTSPEDIDYFDNVARAVAKTDADSAEVLLDGLHDALKKSGRMAARLDLLRRHGRTLFKKPNELHSAILDSIRKLHGDKKSLDALIDRVGLTKATDDVPKTWTKVDRLLGLLSFDVGAVVYMDGKGVGRVEEVNLALESFKVVFEKKLELRVGFNGAPKLMRSLAPGHFLRHKLEEPEALKRRAIENPTELLREVLVSDERAMTSSDVKRLLQGVVSEAQWNSFWNAARRHPQIVGDSAKKTWRWADTAADAHGSVWDSFEAADPQSQIALFRREGERDPELKRRMAAKLDEVALERMRQDPGLACEIHMNLERAGVMPANAPYNPEKLVIDTKDLRALCLAIKDRGMRERVYQLVRDRRRDAAEVLAAVFWQEPDAKALDLLSDAISGASSSAWETVYEQILSTPRKSPAGFTWLVERAANRTEWLKRNPIRLLKQYLWALSHEDFLPFRAARLVPLADSGGTVPRLLGHLEIEQAESALDAIQKAASLLDYQRQPLITAIQLRFPELHKEKEAPLYATQGQIDAKRAELKKLAEEDIPVNRRAIETAREMGDLRENFEYHAARARHEFLSARAGKLNEELRRVRPIEAHQVRGNEVTIGARVSLRHPGGVKVYTILGPWDSDPDNDILSNESEIAGQMLGIKLGDAVVLGGIPHVVEKIEPYTQS